MDNNFHIPTRNLAAFILRLAELVKVAGKLKVDAAIGYTEVGRYSSIVHSTRGDEYVVVEVTGEAPSLDGWTLRGRYDFTAVAGACIFMAVPGYDVTPEQRVVESTRCDHCLALRARNDVFLLEHTDGRTTVVGRSCLKNYLGHMSPAAVARWFEIVSEGLSDCERFSTGTHGPQYYDLALVLAYAARCVRIDGWHKAASDCPTRSAVALMFADPAYLRQPERDERNAMLDTVTPGDHDRAAACIEWMKALSPTSSYESGLLALTEGVGVGDKAMGIAVSAIAAYKRHLGEALYPEQAPIRPSVHVGELKQRLTLALTYAGHAGFEGTYGYTWIHRFNDADGNDFVWMTGSTSLPDFEPGATIEVKATIKAHDEWKDRPQTKLARVAVLTEVAA